ncbi:hypothetical protein [Cellulomonas sp. URHD0024]|uniref:hypothetical protein n=1 Tax=Cellulomonas sp. URHD0024 TaxID=1302620 RepID=UPI0003F8E6EB|nr:hypothetical protein [Cellulomonas sp. URHD0024]
MIGAASQQEYGAFNPRFVGISLSFESGDNLQEFFRYLRDTDGAERADGSQADFNTIALRSTLQHEVRHFHDFLISGYSSNIFWLRLQAVANGSLIFTTVRDLPGTCLPMPLVRWLGLSDDDRNEVLAAWSDDLGIEAVTPSLPHLTREQLLSGSLAASPGVYLVDDRPADEQFRLYVESTAIGYAGIEQLVRGPGTASLPPRLVHEVSALCAQTAAIERDQGPVAMQRFVLFLLESELPQAKSWRFFHYLGSMFAGVDPLEVEPLSTTARIQRLALWCLIGNYEREGLNASPSARASALAEVALGASRPPPFANEAEDPSATWDAWDTSTEVVPWRDSLRALLERSRRTTERYRDLLERSEGDTAIPALIAQVDNDVSAQRRQAIDVLLADPGALADPFRYVRLPEDTLPFPALKLELTSDFDALPVRTDGPGMRLLQQIDAQGKEVGRGVALASPTEQDGAEMLDRALQLERFSSWLDVQFSDIDVPDHVAAAARAGIRDITGKIPLSIV